MQFDGVGSNAALTMLEIEEADPGDLDRDVGPVPLGVNRVMGVERTASISNGGAEGAGGLDTPGRRNFRDHRLADAVPPVPGCL